MDSDSLTERLTLTNAIAAFNEHFQEMSRRKLFLAEIEVMTKAKKLRFAMTSISVAVALLAFEALYFFSAPALDEEQKMLLSWQGVRAPDFAVTNLNGQSIHLADLKGKRVILNFWATWCVPCQEELPNFIKLRTETSPTNVVILGLSTDDDVTQKTFAQRVGINYSLAQLKNLPSPYQDVAEIPTTMLIDRNGVVQKFLFGPQNLQSLEQIANEPDFAGTVKPSPDASK